jgi:hypothetical protein
MRKLVLAVSGGLLFALVGAGGCASERASCEDNDCGDGLGDLAQPAFVVGSFVPWTLSNGQLRLCFTRDSSLTVTEFTTIRDRVVTTLNNTWGNVPALDFVSSCTAPAMSITLVKGGGSGSCGLGNGASCTIWGSASDLPDVDGTAVHEVGHGLGLLHEHQRPDAGTLCPFEQAILDGCQKCTALTCTAGEANACWFAAPAASTITVSAADKATAATLYSGGKAACLPCSQGTCAIGSCAGTGTCSPAASYWGCFGRNPTAGTINVSAGDRSTAQGRVSDRTKIGSGGILTWYDPRSIMNYCSGVNGRTDAIPTQFDMLGMEMLYSANRTYALACGTGCFGTTTGLVTSSTGSVVSEWIRRGSVGVPFRVSGTSTDVYSYSVAGLANGSSTLNYTFRDPVGRSRSGSGTVTKGNPLYAAIAGAAVMIY